MIKIIPHASNSITIEIENGDQFNINTDGDRLDIRARRVTYGVIKITKSNCTAFQ